MKRFFTAMLAALAISAPLSAQTPRQRPPRLLVVITVDQFSADLFNEYRGNFTGGLARLTRGVVFANGYQAHGVTQTCPGQASIGTGALPARTGMVANYWYDFAAQRDTKLIYCAEDENAPVTTMSPVHLRVPALGDRLKQANPASRSVAVAGKDRTAMMLGGRAPDQRWWWQDSAFVQNGSAAPAPVAARVNQAVAGAIAQPRAPLVPPAFCASKDKAYDVGNGRTVGTHRFQRAAGDASAFTLSPELDGATLTLAAGLVQEMQLGRAAAPDLLAIGLSATDPIGHVYGPGGLETCLQLASLDRDLGDFFAFLDQQQIDYAVALSADHGSMDIPERLRDRGVADAARLDPAATMAAADAAVASELGLTGPLFVGDWFLSPSVPAARRAEVIARTKAYLQRQPQLYAVYTKAEIAAHPIAKTPPESWSVIDRLRASYDAQRSSDLAVVYKPHISPYGPGPGAVAGHGTVWDYDRKVPILFWWPGIAQQERTESAMSVDIVPTMASLIGVPVPASEVDGKCVDLLPGAATNCR